MSFELAARYQVDPLTGEDACGIYDCLTDGIAGVVASSSAIPAFLEDLLDVYPEDGEIDVSSPWASGVYSNGECVLLSISWSRKDEVSRVVERLAGKYGLAVYDPQSRLVKSP